MIDTIYCEVIHLKGTKIQNVSNFDFDSENTIFEKFTTHQTSVIGFIDDGELKLEDCSINYNHVHTSKGFIFFSEWTQKVEIIKSTFSENIGKYGVLYFYHVFVDDSRLRNLAAAPYVDISDSTFSNNHAEKGSAITAFSSNLNIYDTIF